MIKSVFSLHDVCYYPQRRFLPSIPKDASPEDTLLLSYSTFSAMFIVQSQKRDGWKCRAISSDIWKQTLPTATIYVSLAASVTSPTREPLPLFISIAATASCCFLSPFSLFRPSILEFFSAAVTRAIRFLSLKRSVTSSRQCFVVHNFSCENSRTSFPFLIVFGVVSLCCRVRNFSASAFAFAMTIPWERPKAKPNCVISVQKLKETKGKLVGSEISSSKGVFCCSTGWCRVN